MKLRLNNKLRYSLYAVLCAVFLSSCQEELYTKEECKMFQIGDTIYVKKFHTIERNVVLKNDPKKEIIEVRNLKYEWDIDILEYDSFRFK